VLKISVLKKALAISHFMPATNLLAILGSKFTAVHLFIPEGALEI
jgi:hypothetical protein